MITSTRNQEDQQGESTSWLSTRAGILIDPDRQSADERLIHLHRQMKKQDPAAVKAPLGIAPPPLPIVTGANRNHNTPSTIHQYLISHSGEDMVNRSPPTDLHPGISHSRRTTSTERTVSPPRERARKHRIAWHTCSTLWIHRGRLFVIRLCTLCRDKRQEM